MSSKHPADVFQHNLSVLNGYGDAFPESTLFGSLLDWLKDTIDKNLHDELFVKDYLPAIRESQAYQGKRPFASVVMRTQGRRPEALREALLCLQSQSDQDFEVLLIGHKLTEAQRKLIEEVLSEQQPDFREKIRFLTLDHGERATPINFAFARALGTYAIIHDDDDIVMEDWMESFHQAARERFGTILHAYVVSQKWMQIETPSGLTALRATDKPDNAFCTHFDILTELYLNVCPPIGLAFPVAPFQKLGFRFDETMTTTEDWDYILRTAMLFGVTDIKHPTSIYRIWVNAESSQTVHSQDEWQANYDRIQNKLLGMPILMDKGYSQWIRQIIIDRNGMNTPPPDSEYERLYMEVIHSHAWRMTKPMRVLGTWVKRLLG